MKLFLKSNIYFLLMLTLFVCVFYSNVWSVYLNYLGKARNQFSLFVLFFLLVEFIVFNILKFDGKKLILLSIVPLAMVAMLTSFNLTFLNIAIISMVMITGVIIKISLSIDNYDPFISFVIGYGVLANLLYIPYLFGSIAFSYFYITVITIFVLLLVCMRLEIINRIRIEFDRNKIDTSSIVITYITFLFLASVLLTFNWDDLNGYIYLPLRSVIENHSILKPEIPGSLTFLSFHSLSFISIIGWIASSNNYEFVFAYKQFNAITLSIAFLWLYSTVSKGMRSSVYASLTFIIIASSAIWYIEIASNYTDFPVFLLAVYLLAAIYNPVNGLRFIEKITLYSLFLAVTLKSIVIVIPLIVLDLTKDFSWKKIFQIPILIVPSSFVFIRNFLLTGNPTFPAANNFWKSAFFFSDSNNIVVSKYIPPWPLDGSLLGALLSNSDAAVKLFYASESIFYSPLIFALSSTVAFYSIFNRKITFKSNEFIQVAVVIFFLVIWLPGAQYRYFIPFFVIFSVGIVEFAKQFIIIKDIDFSSSFVFRFVSCVLLASSFISPYNGFPLKIVERHVFSSVGKQWDKKIEFYEKVNKYFYTRGDINPKILIYYLQDKIFLDSNQVYEYDWYDYGNVIDIMKIINNVNIHLEDKNNLTLSILCEKGFTHMILSNEFLSPGFMRHLRVIIPGDSQSLYEIGCYKNDK